jgi:chromosome segregation ATPase
MQSKSTRGVQQDEIWTAADALLKDGLRPTIERVRQKMGRGSPNTVSPMLEAWFSSLGPRLGTISASEQAGDLPAPVWQAMKQLWDTALMSTREQAAQELATSHQLLTDERTALEVQKAQLNREAQSFSDRQAALDKAADISRVHIIDLNARLTESHARMARFESEIDELRVCLAAAATQSEADRRRINDEVQRHAQERGRLEERATANERRLLGELDRARQDAKQTRLSIVETERRSQATLKGLELANKTLDEQLTQSQAALQSTQQALAAANAHSLELRHLLDQERTATRGALERLDRSLSEAADQTAKKVAHKNPTMALRSKRLSARKG